MSKNKLRMSPSFGRSSKEEPEVTQTCIGIVFLRTEEGLKVPLFLREKGSDEWWDLPGGKRFINEHPFNAMQREMKEELGIRVIADGFIDSMKHPVLKGDRDRNFIICRHIQGVPENKLPDEHKEMRLFNVEDAIEKLGHRITPEVTNYMRGYVSNQSFVLPLTEIKP